MKRVIFLLFCMMKLSSAQISQVNVSISVMPPYSPYIADYFNNQNKTLLTLIPNGSVSDRTEVYFKASIVGDNGVSISTKPDYKPSSGLPIQGLMPQILTGNKLERYFSTSNLNFTGITLQQLSIGNGLPEGNYTFCIQVFDFFTNLPLSDGAPIGCSAPLNIQHLDPPLPLLPQCGGDVLPNPIQNVLFNWSFNPGYTPNLRYLLKIVPVLSTQNPNDAINTMVTPAFFEKIVAATSYLYGPSDPQLIVGQRYAYRIKAFDPSNRLLFKNNGESEVCSFVYGESAPIIPPSLSQDKITILNPLCGNSPVDSNLFYLKWQDITQNTRKGASLAGIVTYKVEIRNFVPRTPGKVLDFNSLNLVFSAITSNQFYQEKTATMKLIDKKSYYSKVFKLVNGVVSGESQHCQFTYNFIPPKPRAEPSKLIVKGQIVYTSEGKTEEFLLYKTPITIKEQYYFATKDNPDVALHQYPSNPINGNALKTYLRTTDHDGYFAGVSNFADVGIVNEQFTATHFSHKGMKGVLVHALTVEINSAYYIKINKTFMASTNNTLDFGKLYTKVFTFKLEVQVKKGYKDAKGLQQDFANCNVRLYRQMYQPTGAPIYKSTYGWDIPKPNAIDNYVLLEHANTVASTNEIGEKSQTVVFLHLPCTQNANQHFLITLEQQGINQGTQVFHQVITPNQTQPGNHKKTIKLTYITPDLPKSKVNGQIFFAYKGSTASQPLSTNLLLKVCYVTNVDGKKVVINSFNTNKLGQNQNNTNSIMDIFNKAYPDNGKTVAVTNSKANGEFEFNFQNVESYSEASFSFVSTKTGEFGWKFSGQIYRCLRVVVNNGHYTNPDDDILIEPLQQVNVGKIVALVRSFQLVVNCKSSQNDGQTIVSGNPVPGLDVVVKRNKAVPNYFPKNEGNIYKTNNVPEDLATANAIAYQMSNSEGNAYLNDIVVSNGEDFAKLKIQVRSPDLKGDFSYNGNAEINITKLMLLSSNPNFYIDAVYNSDYNVPTLNYTITVFPTLPKVKGRVLDQSKTSSGLPNALATLEEKSLSLFGSNVVKVKTLTDQNGYFQFNYLKVQKTASGTVNGPDRKLIVEKSGYHYQAFMGMKLPFVKEIGILKPGSQVVIPEIYLTPSATLTGNVVDENGSPVACYVAVLGADLKETTYKYVGNSGGFAQFNSVYNIQLPPGKDLKIVVWPKDLKYFIDTITVAEVKAGNNIKDLVVYKRLHRVKVLVSEKTTANFNGKKVEVYKAVPNAVVSIEEHIATTSAEGFAVLNFANTSTKNFTLKVNGPNGGSFIQKMVQITNFETKSEASLIKVNLEKGVSLLGTITANGSPVKGAKVLVEMGPATTPIFTFSDDIGKYSLTGFPTAADKSAVVKVIAPESNPNNLIGTEAKVVFTNSSTKKDFALQAFTGFEVNNFFGFKLEITTLRIINADEVEVSGFINLNEMSNSFTLAENAKPTFSKLIIKKGIRVNSNGIIEGIPQKTELATNLGILKLKYGKHINTILSAQQTLQGKTLSVKKEDNVTGIWGRVYIVDNSFDFPGSYLSFGKTNFYFADLNQNNASKLIVAPYSTASKVQGPKTTYNLCNSKGEALEFNFLQFKAKANPKTSTITLMPNGEPRLAMDTEIKANFENMNPSDLKIELGIFEMNHEKIFPLSGKQKIKFKLENWDVEVNNWQLTANKGGIFSNDGFVNTGVVQVPFKYFHMQNHLLKFDQFTLSNLSLGGVTPLEVSVGVSTIFGFDKSTGTDKKPHWKLSLVGNAAKPAAQFGGMEGLAPGKKIGIEVLSLISNGEQLLSFGAATTPIVLYDVIKFTPSTITSYSDYYTLGGKLDLGIPRINANLTGNLVVKGKNGGKIELLPQQFEFEGKGFVKFKTNGNGDQKQTLSKGKLVLLGTIEEPGKTPQFKCELVKNGLNANPGITLLPNQTVSLGVNKLTKVAGNMPVKNNDWDYFSFEGDLTGFEGVSQEKKRMKFTVYGDIKAEGQSVKMDNINTPFGGMELVYDYNNSRLMGHMDIAMDFSESLSVLGVANMLFDNQGFYISAAAQVTAPVVNTFNAGILVGAYGKMPANVLNDLVKFNYNKNVPCYLTNNGLKGFFITGGRELPLQVPSFSIDIPPGLALVSVSAGATSGVEVQLGMDFKKGTILTAQALIYAKAWAGIGSISCTDASANAAAEIMVTGTYNAGVFNIDGCGSLLLDVKGSQKVPLLVDCVAPEISLNTTLGAKYLIHLGSDGFYQKVKFSLGSDASNCTAKINCN